MDVEGLFVTNFMKTVSTGPSNRSFQYVNPKHFDEITVMNDPEEITKYNDGNSHYRSPILARQAGDADESFTEKSPKKDKKWSLGGFFRRKKKEVESESSSDEEAPPKRGFLQRRKLKKEDKRKKRPSKALGTFDHVVVAPVLYSGNTVTNGIGRDEESGGILSEPNTGSFGNISRSLPKLSNSIGSKDVINKSSRESLNKNRSEITTSRGSLQSSNDGSGKKSRREKVKARVEALRDRLKNDSSSDEGSQRSTASSITRFKSEESLVKSQNGSLTRKSRAARTERYIKRLTKEEENVLNKEAEVDKHKISNIDLSQSKVQINSRWIVVDDVQINTPSIKPQAKPQVNLNYASSAPQPQKPFTGISTIPPSHNVVHRTHSNMSENQRNHYINQNIYQNNNRRQLDPTLQNNFKNNYLHRDPKNDHLSEQRSFSYDCNINRSPTPQEGEILHVQFPIGKPVPKPRNPTMINHYSSNQSLQRTPPPPPPPRDPRRIYSNLQYENNNRPMSYAFENGNQRRSSIGPAMPLVDRSSSVRSNNNYPPNPIVNRSSSFGWQPNYRSNSEDHIAQVNQYMNLQNRPASATPDMPQQRFIRRHPKLDQYTYFADKTPRSRKPIHIATPVPQPDQTYLSDSQMLARAANTNRHPINAASEFWKQKDIEETRRKSQMLDITNKDKVTKKSEQEVKNKSFSIISIPLKQDFSTTSPTNSDLSPLYPKQVFEQNMETVRPLPKPMEKTEKDKVLSIKKDPPAPPVRGSSRHSSGSSVDNNWTHDADGNEKKRRSSNLEDALDELEAIYKSLRLGDEDLLDRAERRDVPVAAQKRFTAINKEQFSKWNSSKGAQSDSGYNYGIDVVDCLPKKREIKIKKIPDRVNDDMAYRRLCKDKTSPTEPPVAQLSYLLTSPLLGNLSDEYSDNIGNSDEPDITLDDVVYRNFKHANNTLKVMEPQPQFGIPLGPITAASNSDYLHAVPENTSRPRFVPQKSPDIVKDDLAYRSLRKDNIKDPTLPPLGPDDYINNNSSKEIDKAVKKKRAVRSVSANIFNLMNRDNSSNDNEFDKAQSLTDIAVEMEIAHKMLKEHNSKIFSKMTVSDPESRNNKPSFNFNYTPTSTETLTESKSNLLNEPNETNLQQKLRVYVPMSVDEVNINQKPPLCPTPDKKSSKPPTKESTPNRVSPVTDEENSLDKSHLEKLLSVLATEALETSAKLDNELRLLDEEKSRKCTPRMSGANTPNREENRVTFKSTNEKLMDIDAVSEHAKLCEKLLECVVESTDLIAPKIPEVELTEEVNDMPNEPSIYKSVANIIVTRKADVPTPADPRPELYSESDHDYDNISHKSKEKSPDEELSVLLELDNNIISDDDCKDSSEELSDDKTLKSSLTISLVPSVTETFKKVQGDLCKEGEECHHVECFASNSPECAFCNKQTENLTLILNPPADFENETLLTSFDNMFGNEYELSSGFHTESNCSSSPDSLLENAEHPTEDFKIMYNTEITILDNEIVYNPILEHNAEFSSMSSTGSNNITDYRDFLCNLHSEVSPNRFGNSFLRTETRGDATSSKLDLVTRSKDIETVSHSNVKPDILNHENLKLDLFYNINHTLDQSDNEIILNNNREDENITSKLNISLGDAQSFTKYTAKNSVTDNKLIHISNNDSLFVKSFLSSDFSNKKSPTSTSASSENSELSVFRTDSEVDKNAYLEKNKASSLACVLNDNIKVINTMDNHLDDNNQTTCIIESFITKNNDEKLSENADVNNQTKKSISIEGLSDNETLNCNKLDKSLLKLSSSEAINANSTGNLDNCIKNCEKVLMVSLSDILKDNNKPQHNSNFHQSFPHKSLTEDVFDIETSESTFENSDLLLFKSDKSIDDSNTITKKLESLLQEYSSFEDASDNETAVTENCDKILPKSLSENLFDNNKTQNNTNICKSELLLLKSSSSNCSVDDIDKTDKICIKPENFNESGNIEYNTISFESNDLIIQPSSTENFSDTDISKSDDSEKILIKSLSENFINSKMFSSSPDLIKSLSHGDINAAPENSLSKESQKIADRLNTPSTSFYISDSSLNNSDEDSDKNLPSSSRDGRALVSRNPDTESAKCDVAWYQNPTTLLACSYGIACAHQMALLDVVTLLGLFLAIVSVIAAFVL